MHIGRNICRIRELLNIKQQTLADLLNVSQQTVSKIEQTAQMSAGVVERIAAALGIEASVILHYDDAKIINYLRLSEATHDYRHVLQSQIEFLKKLIMLYENLQDTERNRR